MLLSKEVRIGLLAVISVAIFFIGFYFLKGSNLFSSDQEFYCYYDNVDGLQGAANVQIQGLNVGRIAGMHLEQGKGVKVTIAISKSIVLPAGTVARLQPFDLLTKMIQLELGPGPGAIPTGSQLPTQHEGGIVDNVTAELTPRLKELKSTIIAFDTTLASVNSLVNQRNQQEIAATLRSIHATADNLEQLTGVLKKEASAVTEVLRNANSITANLARNNDTINQLLSNMNGLARQMNNAPVQKTVEELHQAIAQVRGITDKINTNQGSLGMLINNKDLYNNMSAAVRSLDSLERDIKAHPSRYINVTVFGKGK